MTGPKIHINSDYRVLKFFLHTMHKLELIDINSAASILHGYMKKWGKWSH